MQQLGGYVPYLIYSDRSNFVILSTGTVIIVSGDTCFMTFQLLAKSLVDDAVHIEVIALLAASPPMS